MRICVYAIAKNEVKFVNKFMESCNEADYVVVADTGSVDGTQDALRSLGAMVYDYRADWADWPEFSREVWREKLSPWRFDIARNFSLAHVPDDVDICVPLDLDEHIRPGWRKALEKVWADNIVRVRYNYIWSRLSDGTPDIQYWGDKIHRNKCYEWRHPVHECPYFIGSGNEDFTWADITIDHFPDSTKSRGSYLGLLEVANFEDPDNDRNAHYLGREYVFSGDYVKAKAELLRHLSLKSARWDSERASSMRYLARCCNMLGSKDEVVTWLLRACAEASGDREPWLELSQAYHDQKEYLGCYFAAKQALKIKKRPNNYMTNSRTWGNYVYDLIGVSSYYIGLKEESYECFLRVWNGDKSNSRLIGNLKMVRKELGKGACFYVHALVGDWVKFASKPKNVVSDFVIVPGDIIVIPFDVSAPIVGWDILLSDKFDNYSGAFDFNGSIVMDYQCFVNIGMELNLSKSDLVTKIKERSLLKELILQR